MNIKANRYYAGDYQEVSIVPVPDEEKKKIRLKEPRNPVKYLTKPQQQLVNNRNTWRYLRIALQGNFAKGDYFFTLTLRQSELPLPDKVDEAKYLLTNIFLRKVRDRYKKAKQNFKYIWVMEYELDEDGQYLKRVHFHVVMNNVPGVTRDDIEDCWSKGRGKKKKSLGYVNTKRLLPSADNGLEDLANYLSKGKRWKKGKKVWNCSRNLERPKKRKRDHMFSRKQMEKMAFSNDQGRPLIEKRYPNHIIQEIRFKYTEFRGWHLYLKMWRKRE